MMRFLPLIPAKAGTQHIQWCGRDVSQRAPGIPDLALCSHWIPAFAGMSGNQDD